MKVSPNPTIHSGQPFDFGLDSVEEARAAQLHRESLIVDMLYQGPIGPDTYPADLESHILDLQVNAPRNIFGLFELTSQPVRLAVANKLGCFHERWLASGITGGNREVELANFEIYADLMGLAQSQFDTFPWMIKALTADDFRSAKRQQGVAGFISTQLVAGAFPSLDVLRFAWESGLRMLQLTYNGKNSIGCGCTDPDDGGISNFGRQAIALMDDLGVIVDTAHCGRRTTLEACQFSAKPVVASHTAAAMLHRHDRCKSNDELLAIAGTGGVVGIVAVPFFLTSDTHVTINHMLDHIDYVAKLVGPQHVAVGTDWPNQLPHSVLRDFFRDAIGQVGFRSEHNVNPNATISGFRDYLDFANISRGLVSRGYSDSEIEGILGGNFLRVFESVCG